MHLITVTNLYPNPVHPRHGIFVRERLRHLLRNTGIVELTNCVIAPIPWFPFNLRRTLAPLAKVPKVRQDELGFTVHHPRYLALPLVGNFLSPLFYAWAVCSLIRTTANKTLDTLIDSHFGFPDNVAAALLGRILRIKVIATYRGSDLNDMATEVGIRPWTKWALGTVDAIITVSEALKLEAERLTNNGHSVAVIRNGVDTNIFRPNIDRNRCRKELRIEGPTILSVGNLLQLKGHDLVISALLELPEHRVIVVGQGPEETRLLTLARSLGVVHRVRFETNMSQVELAEYYASVDVLVLASSREGLPNVVLEALACGLPVVATNVGGTPEVLTYPIQGVLLDERTANAISQAILSLPYPKSHEERAKIAESISAFDWRTTTLRIDETFQKVLQLPS